MDHPSLSRARLLQKISEKFPTPGQRLRDPLGGFGYELPEAEDLVWREIPSDGANNWMLGGPNPSYQFNLHNANNNLIVVAANNTCHGQIFIRGSNNTAILIGPEVGNHPVNVQFHHSDHLFYFGRGCTSNTATFAMGGDGTSIIVGEDCMFSAFVDVMTDDLHGIIDMKNGAHLNTGASILFEPHVWAGLSTMFLKGITIGFGSIVGAKSVVTRDVERMSSVAGTPAVTVRRDVSWTRERIPNPGAHPWVRQWAENFAATERERTHEG